MLYCLLKRPPPCECLLGTILAKLRGSTASTKRVLLTAELEATAGKLCLLWCRVFFFGRGRGRMDMDEGCGSAAGRVPEACRTAAFGGGGGGDDGEP